MISIIVSQEPILMDKFIGKTKQLLFAKQTSIISSTLLIAAMVMVSRVFGFLRYRTLTAYFTKEQLDIYFAAFRIPDLIFEILITGALTTSFIPFFIKYDKNKDLQSLTISSVINIIILVLFVFILLLTLFLGHIMPIITPGFDASKIQLITYYSQLLLIGQLPFLVFGNFLTGISQARKMFILPAIAPIIYNLAIIVGTALLASSWGLLAPVIGVLFGSIIFFVIQIPIIAISDFQYQFVVKMTKALWEFFKLAVPRIFTVLVAQIDATVDLTLTTLLGSGSYTIFYLAQHLQLLPVSVIGVAFGQASLPYLTEMYQENNTAQFKKVIVDSILNLFFLTIPVACFFMFARTPMVRLFFGSEKFDWQGTNLTAVTLSYFSISLPFHSIYYFLTRCFYAIFDSKTPFYISVFSVFMNAVLSVYFILVLRMPVWSLGISFSVSMILSVLLLLIVLHFKLNGYNVLLLITETVKMIFAAFLASYAANSMKDLLDGLIFDTSRTINVLLLISTVLSFYFLLYLLLSWLFSVREIYLLTQMMFKVKEYKRRITELYTGTQ